MILRSELTERAMDNLAENKVICLKENKLPIIETIKTEQSKSTVYDAFDFGYFAASEETRFVSYGSWDKECGVIDQFNYTVDIQFERTKEDVSALYGEALVYMLQWQRQAFCPNIETVLHSGILHIGKICYYNKIRVPELLKQKVCEPLSLIDEKLFHEELNKNEGHLLGKDMISFLNHLRLRKKRVNGDQTIYPRVMRQRKKHLANLRTRPPMVLNFYLVDIN